MYKVFMRMGGAVTTAFIYQKLKFFIFVIFVLYLNLLQSSINNIENDNTVFFRLLSTMG